MKRQKNKKVIVDATVVWKALKPQYNGFICGYGYHGKRGYNRNAEKRKPLDEKKEGFDPSFFYPLKSFLLTSNI